MGIDENFHTKYRNLERRMRALAKAERNVFLPNPEPEGPVNYVLICMEPSLGRWARSPEDAKSKVKAGFRNFLPSDEVSILHFCVRRYLCATTERYHITDFCKGAMRIDQAGHGRADRYGKWYELLRDEIDLVAAPNARIIAVGNVVFQNLQRQGFQKHRTQIIHYSSLAGRARRDLIRGREDEFQAFKDSVSHADLFATAQEVLTSARVPAEIRQETLARLERFSLTTSRQQLIFNYKLAFEKVRS